MLRDHLPGEHVIKTALTLIAGHHTFINKQQEAQITKLGEDFLGGLSEPLCTWHTPSHTNEDLSKKSAIDPSIKKVVDDVEEVQK